MMIRALSSALALALANSAWASPVTMTGDQALDLAVQLVNDGKHREAEAILATLATGDPTLFDMVPVDRLAAKIAFAEGETARALKLLRGVVKMRPDQWRARYDLAHVLMSSRRDREAERHLRILLAGELPPNIRSSIENDLRGLADRRVIHVRMRAAAAPSTNINAATSAETFALFGVLPVQLDDQAQAQSGVGMNWSLGTTLTPKIAANTKAHLAINSQLTDHKNASFDQAASSLEVGFRHRLKAPFQLSTLVAATATHRGFGGDPYATSIGGRVQLSSVVSPRAAVGVSLSAEDVSYQQRPDRNGNRFQFNAFGQRIFAPWFRAGLTAAATREQAAAKSLSNNQYALLGTINAKAPLGFHVGVLPSITFRRYDEAAAIYGLRRKDVTLEMGTSIGHERVRWNGFRPSLVYRYTDNQSTVDLFDFDRHAVDISFDRAF